MKVKKRKKSTRYRGFGSAKRGPKKRTRGLGNQGGKGMSGTGKHSGQKKSLIIHLYGMDYFGGDKTLRRGHVAPKPEAINLTQVEGMLETFKAQGKLKGSELDLTGYKLLGVGELKTKLTIKASAASASALESAKKSGSKIILPEVREEVTPEVKGKAEIKAEAKQARAKK